MRLQNLKGKNLTMQKLPNEAFEPTTPPIWIRKQEDVIFCSSVCLNRNVKGFKFPYKASTEDRKKVGARILGKIHHSALADDFRYAQFSDMPFELKGRIYERRISFSTVSLEEREEDSMTLLISNDETSAIVINCDDHLQVKVTLPGFCVKKCLEVAEGIVNQISMDFANQSPFGYLTSSPAIMGSGLQIEVMTHLPATCLIIEPEKWIVAARVSGVMPEGFWGYGSIPLGNTFTLCSKNTHRKETMESIEVFERYVNKIVKAERKARKEIDPIEKKDTVMRAYGTLKYVQKVELGEALSGLSLVKMGIQEGIIDQIDELTVDKLFFYVFPAELTHIMKCDPDSSDIARASLIRKAFSIREKEMSKVKE